MVSSHDIGQPLVAEAKCERGALLGRHGCEPVALFLLECLRYSAPHDAEYKC